jgi:hypothetical protein
MPEASRQSENASVYMSVPPYEILGSDLETGFLNEAEAAAALGVKVGRGQRLNESDCRVDKCEVSKSNDDHDAADGEECSFGNKASERWSRFRNLSFSGSRSDPDSDR